MTLKLLRCFLVLTLVFPVVRAQNAPSDSPAVEKKKAREECEKKTLALVDEIIKSSQSLKLPENRIRVAIGLAGPLWPVDKSRARSLFVEALKSLTEMNTASKTADSPYFNQTQMTHQLRQEILQTAANYDPKLAADFLRSTRVESTSRAPNSGLTNFEASLAMGVAVQIASKDPHEALNVAEDSLKFGLDYGALNLLPALQSQQKVLAERFLEDILKAIRIYGIGNSSATSVAMNLLLTWVENNRVAADPSFSRTTNDLSLSNLNEDTARALSNQIISALLNKEPAKTVTAYGRTFIDGPSTLYPAQVQGILQSLKPLLPEMERLVPNRVSELRSHIVEFEKSYRAQQGPWGKYEQITQGTSEEIAEAAKSAPPEIVDNLFQQAAWKAINQGDDARAQELVEKISDSRQRTEMQFQLARQGFSRAREQKSLAEARAFLSRLPAVEQASQLAQLAASSITEGDKAAAFQFLSEAQSLLADRAPNYVQLQAQMQIVRAYANLDATKSLPIVEKVTDQVNELVAAAVVLDGFDVQGYFRGGEFVIGGGNSLNVMAQEIGQSLAFMARSDLDGARISADRFQRPEMRLIALLQIAQAALGLVSSP